MKLLRLNEQLAEKQKINSEQRENLQKLYQKMDKLFKKEKLAKSIEYPQNKNFVESLKDIEFQLQENWNFPKDELFHTWWNKFSKCSCPKLDNNERFGMEKIINCSCVIHGYMCKENKMKSQS